ncbi:MAG: hypothetical protein KAS64_05475 [Spirochaetes bacterium]|nr:hypothetical protein [Spirochaetota bacterium]
MTITKGQQPNEFDLKGLGFNQIIMIKKACTEYAKQGHSSAAKLSAELDRELENTTV